MRVQARPRRGGGRRAGERRRSGRGGARRRSSGFGRGSCGGELRAQRLEPHHLGQQRGREPALEPPVALDLLGRERRRGRRGLARAGVEGAERGGSSPKKRRHAAIERARRPSHRGSVGALLVGSAAAAAAAAAAVAAAASDAAAVPSGRQGRRRPCRRLLLEEGEGKCWRRSHRRRRRRLRPSLTPASPGPRAPPTRHGRCERPEEVHLVRERVEMLLYRGRR